MRGNKLVTNPAKENIKLAKKLAFKGLSALYQKTRPLRKIPDINQVKPRTLIYVNSTSGNDITGNGSIKLPFQTLSYAISVANPGNTVYVEAGTYLLTTTLNLVNEVNIYFAKGAIVTDDSSGSYNLFSFTSNVKAIIYGNVDLIASNIAFDISSNINVDLIVEGHNFSAITMFNIASNNLILDIIANIITTQRDILAINGTVSNDIVLKTNVLSAQFYIVYVGDNIPGSASIEAEFINQGNFYYNSTTFYTYVKTHVYNNPYNGNDSNSINFNNSATATNTFILEADNVSITNQLISSNGANIVLKCKDISVSLDYQLSDDVIGIHAGDSNKFFLLFETCSIQLNENNVLAFDIYTDAYIQGDQLFIIGVTENAINFEGSSDNYVYMDVEDINIMIQLPEGHMNDTLYDIINSSNLYLKAEFYQTLSDVTIQNADNTCNVYIKYYNNFYTSRGFNSNVQTNTVLPTNDNIFSFQEKIRNHFEARQKSSTFTNNKFFNKEKSSTRQRVSTKERVSSKEKSSAKGKGSTKERVSTKEKFSSRKQLKIFNPNGSGGPGPVKFANSLFENYGGEMNIKLKDLLNLSFSQIFANNENTSSVFTADTINSLNIEFEGNLFDFHGFTKLSIDTINFYNNIRGIIIDTPNIIFFVESTGSFFGFVESINATPQTIVIQDNSIVSLYFNYDDINISDIGGFILGGTNEVILKGKVINTSYVDTAGLIVGEYGGQQNLDFKLKHLYAESLFTAFDFENDTPTNANISVKDAQIINEIFVYIAINGASAGIIKYIGDELYTNFAEVVFSLYGFIDVNAIIKYVYTETQIVNIEQGNFKLCSEKVVSDQTYIQNPMPVFIANVGDMVLDIEKLVVIIPSTNGSIVSNGISGIPAIIDMENIANLFAKIGLLISNFSILNQNSASIALLEVCKAFVNLVADTPTINLNLLSQNITIGGEYESNTNPLIYAIPNTPYMSFNLLKSKLITDTDYSIDAGGIVNVFVKETSFANNDYDDTVITLIPPNSIKTVPGLTI